MPKHHEPIEVIAGEPWDIPRPDWASRQATSETSKSENEFKEKRIVLFGN